MANGILGIVPVAQSLALAEHSVKFAKKKDKDALDFIGHGADNNRRGARGAGACERNSS